MKLSKILGAILFLLALNCFISPVYALNYNYYGIESRINNDMTVSSVVTLTINSSVPVLEYRLKFKILNVLVESEHAPVNCETQVTDTSLVSCVFENPENYENTKIR